MENLVDRIEALEQAMREKDERCGALENRLRRWRWGALVGIVGAMLFVPLHPGRAAGKSIESDLYDVRHRVEVLEASSALYKSQIERLQALEAGDAQQISQLQTAVGTLPSIRARIDNLANRLRGAENILIGSSATVPLFRRVGRDIFLVGGNLHIVNGTGDTETINGYGNLIVGYNEARGPGEGPTSHTGSHNVVIGSENNYASFGGIVAGHENQISGPYASVGGGTHNTASAEHSTVSGGHDLTANQPNEWVGGSYHTP